MLRSALNVMLCSLALLLCGSKLSWSGIKDLAPTIENGAAQTPAAGDPKAATSTVTLTMDDFAPDGLYNGTYDMLDLTGSLQILASRPEATICSSVQVDGDLFSDWITLVIEGNLHVAGNVRVGSLVAGSVDVDGALEARGGVFVSDLAVGKQLTAVSGDVRSDNNIIAAAITVTGDVWAGNDVDCREMLCVHGWLTSGGDISAGSDVLCDGITCQGDLSSEHGHIVAGISSIAVGGDLHAGDYVTAGETIAITGTLSPGRFVIAGTNPSMVDPLDVTITCSELTQGAVLLGTLVEPGR